MSFEITFLSALWCRFFITTWNILSNKLFIATYHFNTDLYDHAPTLLICVFSRWIATEARPKRVLFTTQLRLFHLWFQLYKDLVCRGVISCIQDVKGKHGSRQRNTLFLLLYSHQTFKLWPCRLFWWLLQVSKANTSTGVIANHFLRLAPINPN